MKVVLTTTLNRLRKETACPHGYAHLVESLGGVSFDHDAPINLLTILKHNGTEDCLWALRATEQPCESVARLMGADFAESVLPIFERERPNDTRPREAIKAARVFARGEISAASGASIAAWDAARDAAMDSAMDSAMAAAAAEAAAWAVTSATAWSAVLAAASAAAEASTATRTPPWAYAAAESATCWDASGDADWDAAWAAARTAQSEIIERYLAAETEVSA